MKEDDISSTAKSPKSPRRSLAEAIEAVKKLYAEAKRSSIKREVAAKPLGYASLNGSALTVLSTLIQYGLLDQGPGTVSVSQLAMQILHPVNEAQRIEALRKAALLPRVFSDIHTSHHGVSEEVLANQLTQGRYPNDVARQMARIYYENSKLAKLDEARNVPTEEGTEELENTENTVKGSEKGGIKDDITGTGKNEKVIKNDSSEDKNKVLATYKIPLGANEAELIFRGQSLEPDDFETLQEYVRLFKRQYERKLKIAPKVKFPAEAIWKNKDNDKPVVLTEVMGSFEGVTYYKSEDGTGIPESELTFA